ncbi:putative acireductone dioxygenase [Ixodes scapularis]
MDTAGASASTSSTTEGKASSKEDGRAKLDDVKKEKGWNSERRCPIDPKDEGYQKLLATYVCREHRHEEAEIRYLEWGSLYFDVRDDKDRWVRTDVRAGDHIVLPPQCYHRFMPKTPDVSFGNRPIVRNS